MVWLLVGPPTQLENNGCTREVTVVSAYGVVMMALWCQGLRQLAGTPLAVGYFACATWAPLGLQFVKANWIPNRRHSGRQTPPIQGIGLANSTYSRIALERDRLLAKPIPDHVCDQIIQDPVSSFPYHDSSAEVKLNNIDEASAYTLLVIDCTASMTYYLRLDASPTVYLYLHRQPSAWPSSILAIAAVFSFLSGTATSTARADDPTSMSILAL
ncbi:hypothetical protein IW262DRAFT_1298173 [Armillaria fumosa]|nr:hypothetical protein IW262DRAFT_1298173 [Armillaria fumosa]